MKIRIRDVITLGLALFAMFFGSGNVIFPPFLGRNCGSEWFVSILGYLIVDILIAVFAVVVMAKNDEGLPGITQRTGKVPSEIIGIAIILCIGPLICIPRAASVSFDMICVSLLGIQNPTWESYVFTAVFFILTWILVARPGKICDIVGNILTPLLILFLAILIISGIVNPITSGGYTGTELEPMKAGVQAGYQSMDLFGCLSFGTIVITTAKTKGYKTVGTRVKVLGYAALICLVLLFASSIGMCYLGSQVTEMLADINSQAELVIEIAKKMFSVGAIVIAILSTLACLTTAIGLTSGTAVYFQRYFKNKDQHKTYLVIITICCVFGFFVSNLGLSTIVSAAQPILTLVFPVAVVLVVLSWFNLQIKSNRVFIGAVLGALISNALLIVNAGFYTIPFIEYLPFFSLGFGWVVPTIIGGIIGWIAGRGRDDRQNLRIWKLYHGQINELEDNFTNNNKDSKTNKSASK